jgi:hypothetical protein
MRVIASKHHGGEIRRNIVSFYASGPRAVAKSDPQMKYTESTAKYAK